MARNLVDYQSLVIFLSCRKHDMVEVALGHTHLRNTNAAARSTNELVAVTY